MSVRVYIGLGSNLSDPLRQLRQALQTLALLPASRLVAQSRFYRSRPLGPQDQPDYLNAVAALDTELAAEELLRQLQAIEQGQGRVRGALRWGPRTLDLDILLYGDAVIDSSRLKVPHPGLAQRNFVIYPLYELAPDLVLPDGRMLRTLRDACSADGLEPLADGGGPDTPSAAVIS